MSAQADFLAVMFTLPLEYADAVVVFSGDGQVRLDVALQALRQRAAHWAVVSGGVDDPPHSLNADAAANYLIGHGLAPDRIIRDNNSQNTHEQAEWLAEEAGRQGWCRVLLAASPYHMPRAFLTVLASLKKRDLDETVCIVPLVASHTSWWGKPDGETRTRLRLWDSEQVKSHEYRAKGHIAFEAEAMEYLRFWEQGQK